MVLDKDSLVLSGQGECVDCWCVCVCERRYVRYVGVGLRARSVEVLQVRELLSKWKVWGLFHNKTQIRNFLKKEVRDVQSGGLG